MRILSDERLNALRSIEGRAKKRRKERKRERKKERKKEREELCARAKGKKNCGAGRG